MRWLPICAICGSHLLPSYVLIYFTLLLKEETCCGAMLMYRNQRSLRRTWWRLFLTRLSSVARVVCRWYAPCLISPSLQNSATLRHFPSMPAAVLEQARVHPQDKRSKLNARHISLVAFAVVPLLLCFPFGCLSLSQEGEYTNRGVVGVVRG